MIIRRNFEEQLGELQEDLLRLGRFVQESHARAMDALQRQDIALAKQVVADDDIADDLTFGIQAQAMQLLALQQPMAKDLRIIASSLRIVIDLERIGDHACDIAKITRSFAGSSAVRVPADLPKLSEMATKMVGDALISFVQHDPQAARQVARDDDGVDDLCEAIQQELMDTMREDATRVEKSTRLLLVARALERVADHATNIAEQVYYVETGEMRNLGREEHNHHQLTSLGAEEEKWTNHAMDKEDGGRKLP